MIPNSGRGSVSQHVLGQDVFERILRRRRAFATQSISDKSLASDSYELRHANPMLQKKHHHDETEHGDKKWLQIAF